MTVSNFLTLLPGINIHTWDCSSFASKKLLLFLCHIFYWRSGDWGFSGKRQSALKAHNESASQPFGVPEEDIYHHR